MEKRNPVNWFQVLALCSTLGLGGAYVWSRQKQAAPPPIAPPVPAVTSETKDEQPTLEPVVVDAQRLVLSGSKSGILMPPPSSDGDDGEEKPKEPRVLMPGSKSALIAPQPQPDDPPKQRTLLPGSKSIDSILRPPPQTPPKQNNENP